MSAREVLRRIAKWWLLYACAPMVAVLFVVQLLLGNETHPQILVIPAAFAWFGWLGSHCFAPKSAGVAAPSTPRLELKAPNPRPGQCPVCSLEDLDERAAGDELLGDTGTALARVVAYGPHRAHSECAAVVPYVPPPRSTSGGMTLGHAVLALDGRPHLCRCPQCERNRPRSTRGGYAAGDVPVSQMGPLPEVLTRPALKPPLVNGTLRDSIKVTGTYWARCGRCPWIGSAGTQDAAEGLLRAHALTCRKRKR